MIVVACSRLAGVLHSSLTRMVHPITFILESCREELGRQTRRALALLSELKAGWQVVA